MKFTFNIYATSPDRINIVKQAFKNNFCMWFVARKFQEELIEYPYSSLSENIEMLPFLKTCDSWYRKYQQLVLSPFSLFSSSILNCWVSPHLKR